MLYRRLLSIMLMVTLVLFSYPTESNAAKSFSKEDYVMMLSKKEQGNQFVPKDAQAMDKKQLYKSVITSMKAKGISVFDSSKGSRPLTKIEMVDFTYSFLTGKAGSGFIERKYFLKGKGIINKNDIGMIKSYEGDVSFVRYESKKTVSITGSESVMFLDVAETDEDSRLLLQFDDGSELTLGEEAAVEINQMIFDPTKNQRDITIKVAMGKIKVKAAKMAGERNFKIETPTAVIGVRGTEFVVDVDKLGKTKITTIEGLVAVRPNLAGDFKVGKKTFKSKKKVAASSKSDEANCCGVSESVTIQTRAEYEVARPIRVEASLGRSSNSRESAIARS